MILKPGARLWSTTSSTAVVVVRPPSGEVELTCDGVALAGTEQPARGGTSQDGVLVGKRYSDPGSGLEVLCTRGGEGTLAVDGRALDLVGARSLPASD